MEEIVKLLLDERFASIVAVILAALLSYIFTKKTDSKKHNVEIHMIQLEKVFLPLYQLVYDKKIEDINFENLLSNMQLKRRKYFLYISVDYLKFVKSLEEKSSDQLSTRTKRECIKYIEYQYLRLKRILGFPYKIEEYFRSYFRYALFKGMIRFLLIVWLSSITIILILGAELYNNYPNLYEILTYIIGIIFVITIIFSFICVIYWICRNTFTWHK